MKLIEEFLENNNILCSECLGKEFEIVENGLKCKCCGFESNVIDNSINEMLQDINSFFEEQSRKTEEKE